MFVVMPSASSILSRFSAAVNWGKMHTVAFRGRKGTDILGFRGCGVWHTHYNTQEYIYKIQRTSTDSPLYHTANSSMFSSIVEYLAYSTMLTPVLSRLHVKKTRAYILHNDSKSSQSNLGKVI